MDDGFMIGMIFILSQVGALQITMLVLKICNLVSCKWWIVLLPTILTLGMLLISLFVGIIVAAMVMGRGYNEEDIMEDEE